MADEQRTLGEHGARLDGVESDVSGIQAELAAIRSQLTAIQVTLAEAQGGWKAMMLIGGASAAVGGLIVKFFPFLRT